MSHQPSFKHSSSKDTSKTLNIPSMTSLKQNSPSSNSTSRQAKDSSTKSLRSGGETPSSSSNLYLKNLSHIVLKSEPAHPESPSSASTNTPLFRPLVKQYSLDHHKMLKSINAANKKNANSFSPKKFTPQAKQNSLPHDQSTFSTMAAQKINESQISKPMAGNNTTRAVSRENPQKRVATKRTQRASHGHELHHVLQKPDPESPSKRGSHYNSPNEETSYVNIRKMKQDYYSSPRSIRTQEGFSHSKRVSTDFSLSVYQSELSSRPSHAEHHLDLNKYDDKTYLLTPSSPLTQREKTESEIATETVYTDISLLDAVSTHHKSSPTNQDKGYTEGLSSFHKNRPDYNHKIFSPSVRKSKIEIIKQHLDEPKVVDVILIDGKWRSVNDPQEVSYIQSLVEDVEEMTRSVLNEKSTQKRKPVKSRSTHNLELLHHITEKPSEDHHKLGLPSKKSNNFFKQKSHDQLIKRPSHKLDDGHHDQKQRGSLVVKSQILQHNDEEHQHQVILSDRSHVEEIIPQEEKPKRAAKRIIPESENSAAKSDGEYKILLSPPKDIKGQIQQSNSEENVPSEIIRVQHEKPETLVEQHIESQTLLSAFEEDGSKIQVENEVEIQQQEDSLHEESSDAKEEDETPEINFTGNTFAQEMESQKIDSCIIQEVDEEQEAVQENQEEEEALKQLCVEEKNEHLIEEQNSNVLEQENSHPQNIIVEASPELLQEEEKGLSDLQNIQPSEVEISSKSLQEEKEETLVEEKNPEDLENSNLHPQNLQPSEVETSPEEQEQKEEKNENVTVENNSSFLEKENLHSQNVIEASTELLHEEMSEKEKSCSISEKISLHQQNIQSTEVQVSPSQLPNEEKNQNNSNVLEKENSHPQNIQPSSQILQEEKNEVGVEEKDPQEIQSSEADISSQPLHEKKEETEIEENNSNIIEKDHSGSQEIQTNIVEASSRLIPEEKNEILVEEKNPSVLENENQQNTQLSEVETSTKLLQEEKNEAVINEKSSIVQEINPQSTQLPEVEISSKSLHEKKESFKVQEDNISDSQNVQTPKLLEEETKEDEKLSHDASPIGRLSVKQEPEKIARDLSSPRSHHESEEKPQDWNNLIGESLKIKKFGEHSPRSHDALDDHEHEHDHESDITVTFEENIAKFETLKKLNNSTGAISLLKDISDDLERYAKEKIKPQEDGTTKVLKIQVYNRLGVEYYTNGQYEETVEQCKKTLEIDQCNVQALFKLYQTNSKLGKKEQASSVIKRVRKIMQNPILFQYNQQFILDKFTLPTQTSSQSNQSFQDMQESRLSFF